MPHEEHADRFRRDTLSVPGGRPRSQYRFSPKPRAPKGHDAQLKTFQDEGTEVCARLLSGEEIFGRITARDKFTISLDGMIIYKHAIETVSRSTRAPAEPHTA